jgi:riboflavin synthase
MFTGLVQTIGSLSLRDREHVEIHCTEANKHLILSDLALGDSVAVDGVCLTVTTIMAQGFVAVISPETLARSTLQSATNGPRIVNLETSLRVGSKLGGHFVTGHVDGIGYLQSSQQTATSWEMIFTTDDDRIRRYILRKGSIAINGISLTVADCSDRGDWFSVAVIPLTYAETNLQYLQPDSLVNLEGDILGKYVEKMLSSPSQNHYRNSHSDTETTSNRGMITPDFLAEHGYL